MRQPTPSHGDPCRVLFEALEAADCHPRGPDYKFVARCPAHEDRMPSLSVCEGADGRAVLWCHAGCDTENVIRALDLRWADLFPDGHRRAPRSRQPQLVTESALDSAKRVLAAAGRTWRPTTEPDMVVVDQCPACRQPEVATKLRLSGATVRRLVHSGEIPALRVGGSIRIRRDDLDALLERPAEHATHEESP